MTFFQTSLHLHFGGEWGDPFIPCRPQAEAFDLYSLSISEMAGQGMEGKMTNFITLKCQYNLRVKVHILYSRFPQIH